MDTRPYIGVAAIVVRGNTVLLGKRTSKHATGTWAFPGGHLEFGESPENAIRREMQEETGMEPISIERAPYTNDVFKDEGKHSVTLFFKITVSDNATPEVLEKEKCERWDWFPWDHLPEPLMLPIIHLQGQGYSPIS